MSCHLPLHPFTSISINYNAHAPGLHWWASLISAKAWNWILIINIIDQYILYLVRSRGVQLQVTSRTLTWTRELDVVNSVNDICVWCQIDSLHPSASYPIVMFCPDARERAGPVFPPPPHSPTNFKWRPSYTRRCSLILQKTSARRYTWYALTNKDRVPAQFLLNQATLHQLHTAFFHTHSLFIYDCFTFTAVQCSYYVWLCCTFADLDQNNFFPGIKASTLASHSQNEWNSSQDLKIEHDLCLFTLQSNLFVHNTTWS